MDRNGSIRTLHISNLAIWSMGQGKGRISFYLPLKTLCDNGHEVWFLTSKKTQENGKVESVNLHNVRNIINPSQKTSLLSSIVSLFNLPFFTLQCLAFGIKYKPDIIYAHGPYSIMPAFLISKLLSSKCIVKLYGIDSKTKWGYRKLSYLALRLPADLYLITNDGTSARTIVQKHKVQSSRLCFWVNGINKNWAHVSMDHQLKSRLSFSGEGIILSLCRLDNWKQVDIIIKSIPKVVKRNKMIKLIVVGDGKERAYLENLAKNLGVSDFIVFVGAVDHQKALDYIRACDVLVSMNALSSICNPVLESMVCGKTVIALNTGTTQELIKDGYNGILVHVDEIDKLPEKILYILQDDDTRKRIGESAQRFILENWPTWEERVNLETNLVEALCMGDYEKYITLKTVADSLLDLTAWRKDLFP